MCGIAGLVYESRHKGTFDWEAFDKSLTEALNISAGEALESDLSERLQSLFASVQGLKEFSSIEQIGTSAERRTLVDKWAQTLTDWEARCSRHVQSAQDLDSLQLEEWNRLLVQGRDLLWAVKEDVLALVGRFDQLLLDREVTPCHSREYRTKGSPRPGQLRGLLPNHAT